MKAQLTVIWINQMDCTSLAIKTDKTKPNNAYVSRTFSEALEKIGRRDNQLSLLFEFDEG